MRNSDGTEARRQEKERKRERAKRLFETVAARMKPKEVPDYLCCRISMELMVDPVITPSGYVPHCAGVWTSTNVLRLTRLGVLGNWRTQSHLRPALAADTPAQNRRGTPIVCVALDGGGGVR